MSKSIVSIMMKSLFFNRSAIFQIFTLCVFLWLACSSAYGATSCNKQTGINSIGLEYVADQCIPENMTDSTYIHYRVNSVQCGGSSVTLYSSYGDTQAPPGGLATNLKNQGYRVLRNKEGSHIVAVHRYYTGLIDGKDMDKYATYNIHTDVVSEAFIPPTPTPNCRGGDFNQPPMEVCAESTANIGTGRLSHNQELFSTQSGQPLSLAVSLHYRSLRFATSALGNGWSHSYEDSLQIASNNVTFWHAGKRREYKLYAGKYYSAKGDYSNLVKNVDNTYTITEKDGLSKNFDSSGKLNTLVDRNGNVLACTYASGKLASVTDPSGRTMALSYDAQGKLDSISDPMGYIHSFVYSGGNLAEVISPDGATWRYTYTSTGLLATKTDPENHQATYTYDANNRLTIAGDPVGQARSYSHQTLASSYKIPDCYPAASIVAKAFNFTEKDGSGWIYTFDPLNETIRTKTDPLGNTYSYTYDRNRNMLSKTEPGIGTTTYTYDSKGNVLSAEDPLNQITTFTYNNFGQILTISGAPGSYAFTYDARGNLLTSSDPVGALTQYGYDVRGNLTSVIDPRNKLSVLSYDDNNLVAITLPTGAVTQFAYDGNGNMLTLTDALGHVIAFAYDARNRLTDITDPGGNVTTYTYDNNGNLSLVTDANDQLTAYRYNYRGQLTEIQNALNARTLLVYGADGCSSCGGVDQLNTVTDAKGQQTSYRYDPVGRLLSLTDQLGMETNFGYGAARNPISLTAADGTTINYSYDALQRLTTKTTPGAGTETFTYDSRGNILTATNDAVSYTFTYDDANRLSATTDNRGYVISYQYDPAGNRTQMILQPGAADERIISYAYDDGNRVTGINSVAGVFGFSYDLRNRRTQLAYPNGATATYSYHPKTGWLSGIDWGWSALGYPQYDNIGNRLQRAEDGTVTNYSYDTINRLTQTAATAAEENYVYDALGNRRAGPTQAEALDQTYVHDSANRMLEGRAGAYVYDARGNQVRRFLNTEIDYWDLHWNADNRLIEAELISNGASVRTVSFKYDPMGRRIEKKSIDGSIFNRR